MEIFTCCRILSLSRGATAVLDLRLQVAGREQPRESAGWEARRTAADGDVGPASALLPSTLLLPRRAAVCCSELG